MVDLSTLTVTRGQNTSEQDNRSWATGFMSEARDRFRMILTAEAKLREQQLDDLRFRASEQWPNAIVQDRLLDDRPYLTINRLPQFIRQVVNAQRTAKPSIRVSPVDNADVKTAEVFQGIIRHIETQSDANVAYITAAEQQVTYGRGYWRVVTEYEDEDSFQQVIRIRRVRNGFSVYLDPAMDILTSGRDPRFGFVVEDVPKDLYVAIYGSESLSSLEDFMSTGDRSPDWMPEGKIRIAEYWYVTITKKKLYHVLFLDDQSEHVVTEKDWKRIPADERAKAKILREREVDAREVYWCKINGSGIIEGNEDKTGGRLWPGKYIPIVPVIGDEIDINGELDLRGMVRDAKDTQRLYNYQNTALAETLALAPKAPFIGYFGQFEGHETKWRQANRRNYPYLEVNPVTANGQTASLPQRNSIDSPIGAIVTAIHQADNDLKSLMGLYEPSLGARSPNTLSGVAIQSLQQQGNQANSNFLDNLNRAIKITGRILVDLIPKIYDAPRILRIIGQDESPKTVMVHAGAPSDQLPQQNDDIMQGLSGVYDLSVGKFDVVISSGPSEDTKRKENLQGLLSIVQANPASFQVLGDLIVGDMDWPQAQAAAIRLKKALPPNLQDDPSGAPPVPPQVQAQMAQMQQQGQQMQAALQQTQQELQKALQSLQSKQAQIDGDIKMRQMEIESSERRDAARNQAEIMREKMRLGAQPTLEQTKTELQAQLMQLQAQIDLQESELTRHHDRVDAVVEHSVTNYQKERERQHQIDLTARSSSPGPKE